MWIFLIIFFYIPTKRGFIIFHGLSDIQNMFFKAIFNDLITITRRFLKIFLQGSAEP